VIAGQSSEMAMRHVAQRLEEAVDKRNEQPGRIYPFHFSVGAATTDENQTESLEDLLHRADGAMYIAKRQKKAFDSGRHEVR
jgi:GGDEF domain-containing protein